MYPTQCYSPSFFPLFSSHNNIIPQNTSSSSVNQLTESKGIGGRHIMINQKCHQMLKFSTQKWVEYIQEGTSNKTDSTPQFFKTFSPIKFCQNTLKKISQVTRSILFKEMTALTIESARENFFEYGGAFVFDQIISPFKGKLQSVGLSLMSYASQSLSTSILHRLVQIPDLLRALGLIKMETLSSVAVNLSTYVGSINPLYMLFLVELADFCVSAVGGYAGMSLAQTDCPFWDNKESMNSYIIRLFQQKVAERLYDQWMPSSMEFSTDVLRFLSQQIIGAIGFHAYYLAFHTYQIGRGRILDGVLPGVDKISHLLVQFLSDLNLDKVSQRSQEHVQLSPPIEENVLFQLFMKGIKVYLFPENASLESSLAEAIITCFQSNLTQQELNQVRFLKYSSQEQMSYILHNIIVSCCTYFNIVTDPKIKRAQEHFDRLYRDVICQKSDNENLLLKGDLVQSCVELREIVGQEIDKYCSSIYASDVQLQIAFDKIIKKYVFRHLNEDEHQVVMQATWITTRKIQEKINSLEQKYFGFALTYKANSDYFLLMLTMHVENIAKIMAFNLIAQRPIEQIQEEMIRLFYINIATSFVSSYQCTWGQTITAAVSSAVKMQLQSVHLDKN